MLLITFPVLNAALVDGQLGAMTLPQGGHAISCGNSLLTIPSNAASLTPIRDVLACSAAIATADQWSPAELRRAISARAC